MLLQIMRIEYGGGVSGGVAQKISETKLRLKLNNFTQKLEFYVLWFWRRRKSVPLLGLKKKEKKRKS